MMTPIEEGLPLGRRMGATIAAPCALRGGRGLLGTVSMNWVRRLSNRHQSGTPRTNYISPRPRACRRRENEQKTPARERTRDSHYDFEVNYAHTSSGSGLGGARKVHSSLERHDGSRARPRLRRGSSESATVFASCSSSRRSWVPEVGPRM